MRKLCDKGRVLQNAVYISESSLRQTANALSRKIHVTKAELKILNKHKNNRDEDRRLFDQHLADCEDCTHG